MVQRFFRRTKYDMPKDKMSKEKADEINPNFLLQTQFQGQCKLKDFVASKLQHVMQRLPANFGSRFWEFRQKYAIPQAPELEQAKRNVQNVAQQIKRDNPFFIAKY